MVEFGDYLFIEEEFKVVALADFFQTLPVKYEPLKKKFIVIGKASKQSILVGANMNPELTIMLERKPVKQSAMARGGKICEVIDGVNKGKYAQVPNAKQDPAFSAIRKVFAEFYDDELCQNASREKGKKSVGLISIDKLKVIGFYD